ncbi:hypothetical protein MRB53_031543 [Persea americana]|uniref:Uncharacterized protein n=1 Tax=Persea americana TaxID=3435 RepID=A0ACC2KPA1_PERAE|nr:hypothetical protein MRB53_031543 [Persea americana]
MVPHKIIAVVEDVDAARYALRWAVQNLLRNGDLVTLIHVYPSSRSKSKKQRRLRLKGFQLALSFKELCLGVPEVKVEIIVTEGDLGTVIISMVKEIGASALILGLHDQSFLYKSATVNTNMNSLNCRILAVKQPSTDTTTRTRDASTDVVLSQIEIVRLCAPEPKSSFRTCPSSLGMICFRSRRRKRGT